MAKSSLCEVFGFGRRKAPHNSYANATNVNIFCKTFLKLGIDPSNYFFFLLFYTFATILEGNHQHLHYNNVLKARVCYCAEMYY